MVMVRCLPFVLGVALLVHASPSAALVAPAHLDGAPALELADGTAVRPAASVDEHVPATMLPAWTAFLDRSGDRGWMAIWDRATGVPSRIYGPGLPMPGAVSDPFIAERHAGSILRQHIALLAPGARAEDFELVSNVVHRGMRTVGFVQRTAGLRVVGGQVSFRYKNDRLFVIGSEALPHAASRGALPLVDDEVARRAAVAWIDADAGEAAALRVDEPVVLPIVRADRVGGYRTVVPVLVDARRPLGRWRVYVDSRTGDVVAREQLLRFAQGQVLYNAPLRHPQGERADFPARGAALTVQGQPVLASDDGGTISWEPDGPASVVTQVVSPLVRVYNAAGDAATATLDILPDGTTTWDRRADELLDAQITTFIHARVVKDYARNLNPELEWLDAQQEANVNIDDSCNAFSDGNSINFFTSSSDCANTGRLADVVYHEFGHSLHAHSIIEGVGAFDGALSEGLSDYLAATITGDPAMGRGFFKSEGPLRHLDPADTEHVWPDDISGVHYTGIIIGGAFWDLRKLLVDHHGPEEGVALADRLYYAAMQRATNIPTTYVEALAEDDDDGDLANGTPNVCDINAAFAAHGLRAVAADIDTLSVEPPREDGHPVTLQVTGLYAECPGDSVAGAAIEWRVRGGDEDGEVPMAEIEDGYEARIPSLPAGTVVEYQVVVEFADGSRRSYPDNAADPHYEFFIGEVVPLYCTDFETDPFAEGWTHGLSAGEAGEGADDWTWGVPAGSAASGDPDAALSGERVLGNDLGGEEYNGLYQPNKVNFALSPEVEVGDYSDVRLQYWRWLNVEDGYFDTATIYANDTLAWQNLDSDNGNGSNLHHQDREWRFHDVPLSSFVSDGAVQVRYEIASDGGLELGGWTLDDFCIVANAASVCGDGTLSGVEECDDGGDNSDDAPDACRADCTLPVCGDGVVDDGEACDGGEDCAADCTLPEDVGGGCGCEAGGGAPSGGALLLAFGVLLALRRRRV